ncbi:MAG: hypothetical protein FJ004_08115 [Chloroflexi bacterium]|nr:hypothetical protein [Chloroflexota bacterium]
MQKVRRAELHRTATEKRRSKMRSTNRIAVSERKQIGKTPVFQYDWISPQRRDAAIQLHELQLKVREQGLSKQDTLLEAELRDLYELDNADRMIVEAKDIGLNAKPFAVTPRATHGMGITVKGAEWNWDLRPIGRVESPIPPQALRAMAWATSKGFDRLWVASPEGIEAELPGLKVTQGLLSRAISAGRSAVTAAGETASAIRESIHIPDPVLVAGFSGSGVLIELCRWK